MRQFTNKMQWNYFSTQESGPDEDHQVQSLKLQKVLDTEDQLNGLTRGIYGVEKGSPVIECFIDSIPLLVKQDETFGLIWNESLQPSDGRYEPGEHFCSTREQERKSVNGLVSFYRDGETGAKFAIKTLQNSDHFHPWEIRIGLVCSSPHLCAVYGVIVRDHRIHILLEHAGSELTKERVWIAKSPDRILTFAKQSFQALEDLHRYGYVHCDIKPDNVMIVREEGEDFKVKVIDFGSCQPIGGFLPPDAHTTRFYWSPEIWQSLNNRDQVICQPAMDVYALALTLYFVQTSGHLMNMLQEKDILPLMTQRSEDLLFIALPETIPSGLRAVMRPCLAGRAEDRWSAQQAANQLDGDAMMQKALSNPRGENYKDLFQQLLRNQSQKHKAQASDTLTSHQSIAPHNNPATVSTRTKSEIQNKKDDSIHFFVGNNKCSEKQEMGLNLKPVGNKIGAEKKPIPLARAKRSGSSNINKWPKPRKIVMKSAAPLKSIKQVKGTNTVISPSTSGINDNQEVHYISSDETMPCSPKKEVEDLKVEKTVSVENCPLHVESTFGVKEIDKSEAVCTKVARERQTNFTSLSGDPCTERETGPSVGDRLKTMTLSPPNSDEQTFLYSALLKTLASQARSSSQVLPMDQLTLPAPSTPCNVGQMFERDKVDEESFFASGTTTSLSNFSHSNTPVQFQSNALENSESLSPGQLENTRAKAKKTQVISQIWSRTQLNTLGKKNLVNQQVNAPKLLRASEENEDEMEFLFQTLETPKFTGQAEDIVDNLYNMLGKDDESALANNVSEMSTQKCVLKKQQTSRDLQLAQCEYQEEPMDTNEDAREKSQKAHNLGFSRLGETSRKRMSIHAKSSVPVKIRAKISQTDTPTTEHLLPNFDKILPENN